MIRVLEPNKDYIIRADKNGIVDDVIEYKHGHWDTDERYPWRGVCSECHKYITYDMDSNAEMNYCPHCGAKMDEVEE